MRKESTTIETTTSNNQVEIAYEMLRGTETVEVVDEMLTNTDASRERAESIFLEQSYTHKVISLETYHRDNLEIGDIISHDATLYKIEKLEYSVEGAKASLKITAKRWE